LSDSQKLLNPSIVSRT